MAEGSAVVVESVYGLTRTVRPAEGWAMREDLQRIIDEQTEPWGIKVVPVEIKDVGIPKTCSPMVREAEAERDRPAKVINADAGSQAAARLAEAAQVLSGNPAALPRYLQTARRSRQARGLDRVAAVAARRHRLGPARSRARPGR